MAMSCHNNRRFPLWAWLAGFAIGVLGGLIGLGGAEFRLPLLIGVFSFAGLEAVIINKLMSLAVVLTAIPARTLSLPFTELFNYGLIMAMMLPASLAGAWIGAGWAMKLSTRALYQVIAVLLLFIGLLLWSEPAQQAHQLIESQGWQWILGALSGFIIGVIASVLGVAGGEFFIPTLILLFGVDVKTAGSLSLLISLPTLIVGLWRYQLGGRLQQVRAYYQFMGWMLFGSLVGVVFGGYALVYIDAHWLMPLLSVILLISAWKMWQHK